MYRFAIPLVLVAACGPNEAEIIAYNDTFPCGCTSSYTGTDGGQAYIDTIQEVAEFYCTDGADAGQAWIDEGIEICEADVQPGDQTYSCTCLCAYNEGCP